MKYSVVFLILLGLVGAICMALLTAGLAVRSRGLMAAQPAPKAAVLMAAHKLEPMTVIDESMVSVKTVPKEQAPATHFSDPIQVTGRMLAVPVIEGQALTPACFAPEGAGFELAAKLPPGMRAITVSLSFPASLKGFLYPGSIVDVLAAFKLQQSENAPGDAVSTTLLENIQILAVDDRTLGQESGNVVKDDLGKSAARQQCLVTLKVDSRQAEALQLASEYGMVSLAIRNPTDRNPLDQDAMLLSKGKLGRMADILSAMVPTKPETQPVSYEAPAEEVKLEKPAPDSTPEWQVDIYRGLKKESLSFPMK